MILEDVRCGTMKIFSLERCERSTLVFEIRSLFDRSINGDTEVMSEYDGRVYSKTSHEAPVSVSRIVIKACLNLVFLSNMCTCFLSIPPENVRKPEVFKGYRKGTRLNLLVKSAFVRKINSRANIQEILAPSKYSLT